MHLNISNLFKGPSNQYSHCNQNSAVFTDSGSDDEDPADHYARHRNHDIIFHPTQSEQAASNRPITLANIAVALIVFCLLIAVLLYLALSGIRLHDAEGVDVTLQIQLVLGGICAIYILMMVKGFLDLYGRASSGYA